MLGICSEETKEKTINIDILVIRLSSITRRTILQYNISQLERVHWLFVKGQGEYFCFFGYERAKNLNGQVLGEQLE